MPDGVKERLDALLQSPAWMGAQSDVARALLLIDVASGAVPRRLPEFARRERDARIRVEFDGRNHQALAARYGLTQRQVRRIVARAS